MSSQDPTQLENSGETHTQEGSGKNQTQGPGRQEMHKQTQKGKTWEALTDTE